MLKITIRYIDWLECKLCMRRELKKKWFFDCACLRCQSSNDLGTYISSPKCTQCKGEKIAPKSPLDHQTDWACESCSSQLNCEEMMKIEQTAKDLIKEMVSQKKR